MHKKRQLVTAGSLFAALIIAPTVPIANASSHMDAPLISLDPAANTTDVYAFVTERDGEKYLTTALAVYPFEEPGIGPNLFQFDPEVVYTIHVSTGEDLAGGLATHTYSFHFDTDVLNPNTVATFLPPGVEEAGDEGQNFRQTFRVSKHTWIRPGEERGQGQGRQRDSRTLGEELLVPPNNQGLVTRFYNQNDDGENRAKEGVDNHDALDRYTRETVHSLEGGYRVFAGQRDDGFFADVQSIFDLDFSFSGPNKAFDSQAGFNVHTIVLEIPLHEIGGEDQFVGVYASTFRSESHLPAHAQGSERADEATEDFIQVGRQGNPLFNEAFVAFEDKDRYNQTKPADDETFRQYAENPELAVLLGLPEEMRTNRTDLSAIFVPDLIKVDLSTPPARLAGGMNEGAAPDDDGFSRLSVFGNDVLPSTVENNPLRNEDGNVPGGWPNGRRFGDDVVDIAVLALFQGEVPNPAEANLDGVPNNNIGYNNVFPYAATPNNGRNHQHHQVAGADDTAENE